MRTGNVEFDQFKKGMYRGQSMVYATVANWLEEDLREGRSIERYVEVLRKESAECAQIADAMDDHSDTPETPDSSNPSAI